MKKLFKKSLALTLALVIIVSALPLVGLVEMNNPFAHLMAFAEVTGKTDYSYLTQNQYMAKILLNHNYQGSATPAIEREDTIPQGQLKFWMDTSKVSTSRVLRDELESSSAFMDSVGAWKVLTFDPAEAYENILEEEDYYITIIMSILDVQMNDSTFLNAWNCSTNKTLISISKSTTKYLKELYSQEVIDLKNTNVSNLTDEEFHNLMIDITETKEGKELYTYLGKDFSAISKFSKGLTTVFDVVQTVSTYSQISSLNKAVENVLAEIYNNCPDGTPMKSAAKKVYEISTEQMPKAVFASIEAGDALINAGFKYCVGKAWDYAITGFLGSLGSHFKFGQAIGKAISNFCFSTDKIIEQYYVLDAVTTFEDVMINTVDSLASDFKADESSENADAYMKSVEMLFSLYDLDCDYTLSFASTAKTKGLYNTLRSWFGKDETLESYKSSIASIKKTINDMKHTLTNIEGYRWYLEYDAPTAYAECFDAPEELPNTSSAYSKTSEVINTYPQIKPQSNTGAMMTYKLSSDNTIIITGCNPSAVGEINIPKDIGGFAVREIASNAFANCTGITSIVTGSTLYTINYRAFYNCTNLSDVKLNSGLKTIGAQAFSGTAITSITVPNTVTSMGNSSNYSCFYGAKSLKSVVFEYGMLKIPSNALRGCSSVTSVVIPDGVTEIGSYAFRGCSGIDLFEAPASLQTINLQAFYNCTNLSDVKLNSGLKTIGAQAFSGTAITSITVPNTVTSMGSSSNCSCFYGAKSLKSVVFEYGMLEIPSYALYGCSSVTSVVIPDGLTEIGSYAFSFCSGIDSFEAPASLQTISLKAFLNCTNLSDVKLNSGLKTIGAQAFSGTAITSITVPNTVTSMGSSSNYSCFYGAKSLKSVVFEYGMLEIPSYALYGCSSVTSVVIPDGLTEIGLYAFSGCVGLKSVVVPVSVTEVDNYSFDNSGLTDIYFLGTETDWLKITVGTYNNPFLRASIHYNYKAEAYTVTYYDGDIVLAQYKVTESQGIPRIEDPEKFGYSFVGWDPEIPDVMPSEDIAFNALWAENVYNVTFIVEGITYMSNSFKIGENIAVPSDPIKTGYVFKGWTPSIPAKMPAQDLTFTAVWEIDSTFIERTIIASGNCGENYSGGWKDNLRWVLYEDGELVISGSGIMGDMSTGSPWYSYKDKIKKLMVNEGVENIGDWAYSGCHNLSTVILPETVLTIGEFAFRNCDISDKFEMPGVQTICKGAFYGSKVQTSMILPDGLLTIEEQAFENTEIWGIDIPESVIYIGSTTFKNCEYITMFSVEFGNQNYTDDSGVLYDINKTTLMQYPQHGCADSYILPETVIEINSGAFEGCQAKSIVLNENISTIGKDAFKYSQIESIVIPENINKIESGTFLRCYKLKTVTISSNVEEIGESAFWSCDNLTDVYFNGTEAEWNAINIGSDNDALLNATIHFGKTSDFCTHSSSAQVTIPATCKEPGMTYRICMICGQTVGETTVIPITDHKMKTVTVEAKCEVDGMSYEICEYCGEIDESNVIPALGHILGDWQIVKEATTAEAGEKIRKCTRCGKKVETEIIPQFRVTSDSKTGISVVYPPDKYEDELNIVVEESFDGSAFNLVNTQTNSVKSFIYDIKMTLNGNEIQPIGNVSVRIPVPEDYNPLRSFIYHVSTETGKVEKMNTVVETIDGKTYFVFTTTHFSYYAIVDETDVKISIKNPSTTTINYGDAIILHADVDGTLPAGARIEWTADNGNFDMSVSADGLTCKVSPKSNGKTAFTATVYDKDGNVISSDTQEMTAKAGLWQKIVAFFKKIFGLTKTIPEAFKGIF